MTLAVGTSGFGPKSKVLKRPLFDRYPAESGHDSDIAEVKRLSHFGPKREWLKTSLEAIE